MRNGKHFFSEKTQSLSVKRKRGRRYRPSNHDDLPHRNLVSDSDIIIEVGKSPVRVGRRDVERRHSNTQNAEAASLLPLHFKFKKGSSLLQKRIFTLQADRLKISRVEDLRRAQSREFSLLENSNSTFLDKGCRTNKPVPARPSNPLRFKTELCRAHEEGGFCRFGAGCTFAHGPGELRFIPRHHKYKTELCRSYHSVGYCQYGIRCHFIHDFEDQSLSPLTTNSLSLLSQYEYFDSTRNPLGSIGVQYEPQSDSDESSSLITLQSCVREDSLLPMPWVSKETHSPLEKSKSFMDGFLPLPLDNSKTLTDVDSVKWSNQSVHSFNKETISPVTLTAGNNSSSKNSIDTILQLPIDNSKSFVDVNSPKLSRSSLQTSDMDYPLSSKPLVTKANMTSFVNSKCFEDIHIPLYVDNSNISAEVLSPVHSSKGCTYNLPSLHKEKSKAVSDFFHTSERHSLLESSVENSVDDNGGNVFHSFPYSKTNDNCEIWDHFLLSNRPSQSVDCLIGEDLWLKS